MDLLGLCSVCGRLQPAVSPAVGAALLALVALSAAACDRHSRPGADGPDAGDDSADVPGPSTEDLDFVFADDQLRTYELTLANADLQRLDADPLSEEYVPGTLTVDGEQYDPVGVRYKGSYSTLESCIDGQGNRICPKLSIKIKFNEFETSQRFHGLKRLNFHSMSADPSLLRERLAYGLFRDMAVAAPRAAHARLIINGQLAGLFALVEQIDGRFTRNRFADGGQGNLYKEVWPMYDQAEPYVQALTTNEEPEPDVSKMLRLAQAIASAADDAERAAVLERWLDVDWMARLLAVDRGIYNGDGVTVWYCFAGEGCRNHNLYWYEEANADRVWLIPWDVDSSLFDPRGGDPYQPFEWDQWPVPCEPVDLPDSAGHVRAPACDPLTRALATQFGDRVAAALTDFLAGPFAVATVQGQLDRWAAQIEPAVAEDRNGPDVEAWRTAVSDLRDAIVALHGRAQAAVAR
jgi:spore coat protein H